MDSPTQTDSAPPLRPRRKEKEPPLAKKPPRRLRWIAGGVLAAVAVFLLAHWIVQALRYETTDNAYVVGHLHPISPRIAGTVTEVLVRENQAVTAGEPLARLDPLRYEIAVQKAQAALAQAKAGEAQALAAVAEAQARTAHAQSEINQAQASLARSAADLQLAEANLHRDAHLYERDTRAIAKSDVDATRSAREAALADRRGAEASLEAARASLAALQASGQAAEAQHDAARANTAAAQAALRDAELERGYTVITAPVAGRVGNRNIEIGSRVEPGQTLFSIAEEEVWIVANFKETQLAGMTPGEPVEIRIDALPGRKFSGKVESLSPASGARFALLPPDNATGNFTKVVQRVPVKIVFDPGSIRDVHERIRQGLSVVVRVAINQGL